MGSPGFAARTLCSRGSTWSAGRGNRVGMIGPNGTGKTTLLELALSHRAPASGTMKSDLTRIGAVAQGATDWAFDESLLFHLATRSEGRSPQSLVQLLLAHKFPLALAERPMRSLSPGERVRAALLSLWCRVPAAELFVLDEPTYGLDFVGAGALCEALAVWPGG